MQIVLQFLNVVIMASRILTSYWENTTINTLPHTDTKITYTISVYKSALERLEENRLKYSSNTVTRICKSLQLNKKSKGKETRDWTHEDDFFFAKEREGNLLPRPPKNTHSENVFVKRTKKLIYLYRKFTW